MFVSTSRYATHGNLTGVPSITVPISYSRNDGLPIGIQIATPWWREDLMFRIAHAVEGSLQTRRKPRVFFDLLKGSAADITSDDESE